MNWPITIDYLPISQPTLQISILLGHYFFAVINHSNTLINKTVLPENADQAKKFEEVLGEAYFLRGLSYFYLVRMYGDVPLILAETDASTYMPRTAVAEIYDQAIIPSLKKAVEILPAKSRSGFSSTPSKWAAEACLADAYMTMAGWPFEKRTRVLLTGSGCS